jgi:hypothetical protein
MKGHNKRCVAPGIRFAGTVGGMLATSGNSGGTETLSTATESALLTVKAVNDRPLLGLSGSANHVHDQPAINLAPFATVSDVRRCGGRAARP